MRLDRVPFHVVIDPPKDQGGLNVVTDAEITTWNAFIRKQARRFVHLNHGALSNRHTSVSLNREGQTIEDIMQELYLNLWTVLRNFDHGKSQKIIDDGQNDLAPEDWKRIFIVTCLKNRSFILGRDQWRERRGNRVPHLDGQWSEALFNSASVNSDEP